MSIVLASAIAGGLSALGNIYSAHQQKKINDANIYNQWQMYNATNEYNSPINTINRYKEAGLNPALMYGNVSPGYASNMNMAVQHAPSYDFSGVGDAITNALNYGQREKQIEIADVSAKKDIALKNAQLEHQKIINDREKAINGYSGVAGYKSSDYIPPDAQATFGNKVLNFKAPLTAIRNWFTGSGAAVPPEVQLKPADLYPAKKGFFFRRKK